MTLTAFDWAVIAGYFALVLAIGIAYYPRASSGIGHYFLSGRSLPWWLAGTSMVATTFAADTPLVVAGLVAHNGIAGNWIWWNAALVRRAALHRTGSCFSPRLPSALPRVASQFSHYGMGQPGHGEDPSGHNGMGSLNGRARQPIFHRSLLINIWTVGRGRRRLRPVRPRHGRDSRFGLVRTSPS